ncbi:MAG: hypothetical protein JKY55_17265 [Aliivibrio sp.]|uniref:hypothetical protein n=1 Tax=Aliivibrio sp. TaxID=1872443 RepID=UPI001A573DA8|nr:hypothetical protein [Aliivibrio sp.]
MDTKENLKLIRQEIGLAKSSGDEKLYFEKLKNFQQFHIEHDFSFGMNEIYRYSKALEKMGFSVEAAKQEKIVDDAVFCFFDDFKNDRCQQIESIAKGIRNYAIHFRCDHPEAPDECFQANTKVESFEDSKLYTKFKHCKNRPRCFCSVTTKKIRN